MKFFFVCHQQSTFLLSKLGNRRIYSVWPRQLFAGSFASGLPSVSGPLRDGAVSSLRFSPFVVFGRSGFCSRWGPGFVGSGFCFPFRLGSNLFRCERVSLVRTRRRAGRSSCRRFRILLHQQLSWSSYLTKLAQDIPLRHGKGSLSQNVGDLGFRVDVLHVNSG